MKFRWVVPLLLVAIAQAGSYLLSAPPSTFDSPAPVDATPIGRSHAFDPVFAIMTQPRGDTGCRGCHIGSERTVGPWWGDDEDTVLQSLETGMSPDGQETFPPPVSGGRMGILGSFLHNGIMPLGGTPWDQDQLTVLDKFLRIYE